MNAALHTSMIDAIYATQLASAATYSNESGFDFSVTVIFTQRDSLALSVADIGIRGSETAARVRVSELAQPRKGDLLHIGGDTWRVDGYDRLNAAEWVLYVVA